MLDSVIEEVEYLKSRIVSRDTILSDLAADLAKLKGIVEGVSHVEPHVMAVATKLFAAIAAADSGNFTAAVMTAVEVVEEVSATVEAIEVELAPWVPQTVITVATVSADP